MNVYIAAPLFSEVERLLNLAICQAIEPICNVHLPQRDGPVIERVVKEGLSPAEAGKLAFTSDIEAIKKCDMVIAILDGRALDEGVCVEIGYAKALGKNIVGFKTDIRRTFPWGNNPMIEGCVDAWISSTEGLISYFRAK